MVALTLGSWLSLVVCNLCFGGMLGSLGVGICIFLTVGFNLFNVFLSVQNVLLAGSEIYLMGWDWVNIADLKLTVSFYSDVLNILMLFLVTIVSSLIHFYSWHYMDLDPSKNRFMSYLSIFTFFMLVLVFADNLLLLFIGWEGVGISSYLLISFWSARLSATKAAVKAMLVNRIGDVFMLIGLSVIIYYLGTTKILVLKNLVEIINYLELQEVLIFGYNIGLIDLIGFMFFFGAMAKSAQIGLHVWLPDAMEGPTPVSALIHAATMVTAGVFLVIRLSFLIEYSNYLLLFIVFIGSMTAFLASMMGVFNYDVKKVVAYSTCSQLGYMFLSCGLSNYMVGFFHLFNHGFFKALLFLSMGSVIHSMQDEQDMRKMGGLVQFMPMTYLAILIGSYALLGLPFLTGFYSKDLLLEMGISRIVIESKFVLVFGILAASVTALYSMRLALYIFFDKYNGYRSSLQHVHENAGQIFFVLVVLSVFSVFLGFVFQDLVVGLGSFLWNNAIYVDILNYSYYDAEFNYGLFTKLAPLFFSLLGVLSYIYIYVNFNYSVLDFGTKYIEFIKYFSTGYYFDYVYNYIFINKAVENVYHMLYKHIEKNVFEYFGAGVVMNVYKLGSFLTKYVFNYFYLHLVLNIFILIFIGNMIILSNLYVTEFLILVLFVLYIRNMKILEYKI